MAVTRHNRRPRVLLDQVFTNIESLANVLGWEQEFRQLEPGRLEASAQVVGNEACKAIRLGFNLGFHQVGKPPNGYLAFGLPDIVPGRLRWAGSDIQQGLLANFNGPVGLDMTSFGNFTGFMLIFSEQSFSANIELAGLDGLPPGSVGDEPFWLPDPAQLEALKSELETIFELARETDAEDTLREYEDSFNHEFAIAILRIMRQSNLPPPLSMRTRQKLLRRAVEYIESKPSEVVAVSTLCQTVGSSYSTLERAFIEEFGVGPKAYMRKLRLTAVQSELARSGRQLRSIAEIAHERGFWHMSAFASEYRKLFGELPSETRARSAHQ